MSKGCLPWDNGGQVAEKPPGSRGGSGNMNSTPGTHWFAWRNRRGSAPLRAACEGCGGSRRWCGATVGSVRGGLWRPTPQVWCITGRCWCTCRGDIPYHLAPPSRVHRESRGVSEDERAPWALRHPLVVATPQSAPVLHPAAAVGPPVGGTRYGAHAVAGRSGFFPCRSGSEWLGVAWSGSGGWLAPAAPAFSLCL